MVYAASIRNCRPCEASGSSVNGRAETPPSPRPRERAVTSPRRRGCSSALAGLEPEVSSEAEGPSAYMIMDYIEGQTLAHYIAFTSRVQQFPAANDIVRFFASISLAIDYAHDVIHRDIKPANILLDSRNTRSNPMGSPILTDFGLVKMMGEATMTVTGMPMGTPLYISPEQIQGQSGDKKSDLYSLGVVITETASVLLGPLTIDQGVASLTYTDPQHRDLLAITSRFLVTEETASVTPNNPSLDRCQWRYFAALPQTRSSKDNFSYLDHLRHLLSNEPGLQRLHLQGGVDFWFLNNVEEMQKEALEVRDHRNIAFVRQQIANILYYLDGKCAPQDLTNAPGNTLPENAAIAHATSIGLLDCPLQSDPPGHITHIGLHLNGIAQAPGASPEQVKRAIEINRDLNPIKAWLVQMRADARQLAVMNDVQLAQAQALRNDLAIQADYAVNGRIDPATQALQPSVRQTCNIIELLANFDVMPSA